MADITSILGGEFTPPTPAPKDPPEKQLTDDIIGHGYKAPDQIIFDGQIHRFSTSGKPNDKTGWYIAHSGRIHAGAFGCWRDGTTINWREDLGRELTAAEQIEHVNRMRETREAAQKAREKRAEVAADTSQSIWESAIPAEDGHAYLVKKRVKSHGLKVTGDGRLIVPMLDESGNIASLQFITDTGDKQFKGGGKAQGAFFYIGSINSQTQTVYIAEGYATAATIYEQTGEPCFIAFNAGNLESVAKTIRTNYTGDLCIVADNDSHGVGKRKADEAAANSKARVVMPPIDGMDANDYFNGGEDLVTLLAPPQPKGLLIDADDLCASTTKLSWLIKHQLQAKAFMMIHGASGGGKTFTVLDMCLHIATGREWMGNKTNQGNVLYLAGEGQHGIKNRILAWKQHHNVTSLNKSMMVFPVALDLDGDGVQQIVAEVDQSGFKPDLIVIDTLNRYMAGDENRSNETRAMINNCASMQDMYDCSILVVHHTGNSEEAQHRARGSSAWKGALDIEFNVTPASDTSPISIKMMKSKDTELSPAIYAELKTVYLDGQFDEDGEQISSAVLVRTDKPTDSRTNNETQKFVDLFKQAWEASSNEYLFGCQFIRSSPLKEWLLTHGHFKTEASANNQTKPSYKGGMMFKMAEAGLARHEAGGWILLQSPDDAALALLD